MQEALVFIIITVAAAYIIWKNVRASKSGKCCGGCDGNCDGAKHDHTDELKK